MENDNLSKFEPFQEWLKAMGLAESQLKPGTKWGFWCGYTSALIDNDLVKFNNEPESGEK